MHVTTDNLDRNANPDPLRTLRAVVANDGTVHFTVDFQAPGSFQGIVTPGTTDEPSGVVAYVYPVVAADLNEAVEPVTCLDTYDMDIPARGSGPAAALGLISESSLAYAIAAIFANTEKLGDTGEPNMISLAEIQNLGSQLLDHFDNAAAVASGAMTLERWAMSGADLRNPFLTHRDDRLLSNGSITDENGADQIWYSVVVDRRGVSSGVNSDGTHGVTEEVRQAAEAEDTLLHDNSGDYSDTAEWRNVIVDEDGAFAGFA